GDDSNRLTILCRSWAGKHSVVIAGVRCYSGQARDRAGEPPQRSRMPPRWMTWAIVAFWLATTTWLVVREVAPRWRAGEPPPYTIDLTDEVSRQDIHWIVVQR